MAASVGGTVVDMDALEELIIGVNRLKLITDEQSVAISKTVSDMDEILSGGQAPELKKAFNDSSTAMHNLAASAEAWVAKLDAQLEKSYGIAKGTVAAKLAEETNKNAKNLGLLKQ